MNKVLVLLFSFIIMTGFSFPKDIGLVDVNNLELTQQNINNYFDMDIGYDFKEDNFSDGTKYYSYTSGFISITMQQDNQTIQDITLTNLSAIQAKQLIRDLGFHPDFFGEMNLNKSSSIHSNLFIGSNKAVTLRNTIPFKSLYNNEEYFIVNIVFTEDRVADFIDAQYSDLLNE